MLSASRYRGPLDAKLEAWGYGAVFVRVSKCNVATDLAANENHSHLTTWQVGNAVRERIDGTPR